MAKKKKNKSAKSRKKLHAKKSPAKKLNHPASEQKDLSTQNDLVVIQLNKSETETTFSKKLEEAISENEQVSRKGLFGGRIILLGAPAGYTKEEWKEYLRKALKNFLKFLAIIFLVGLVTSAVVVIELISDHRILPRVTFAGEDFSYLKLDEAKTKLDQRLKDFEGSSINFRYGDKNISIPLSELGVTYLVDQSFDQLPKFDFQKSNLTNLVGAAINPSDIPAVFQVNQEKFYNTVENKLGLNQLRAKGAQFYLDDKKKFQIKPEKAGIIIDKASLDQELSTLLSEQAIHDLQIPTTPETPSINTQDLKDSQSDLEVKLENEITLHYKSKSWIFKPKNHLEEIVFFKQNGQIVIKISPALLSGFFQKEIFDNFEIPVGNLKITQDKDGKINFDGHARNGLSVNHEQFTKDLELALNSLVPNLDIVGQEVTSVVETSPELQAMGIKELISTGHTAFANSHTNRRHNIGVGMARFNGLIIKPNETFSFNDNLGVVDASTGYRLELVIKAEGTVPDYGGGLCQVSSTAFKAALFAGLPIVERSPHSYAVSYYAQVDGYGLDATIYPGVRDLKFINDTGNNILIQSFTDGDQAYFNYFGTSDGRQVRLENYWRGNYRGAGGTQLIPTSTLPTGVKKQIESANGGFDASWDRVITKNGQDVREKIYSVYRATANRILVGQ